MAEPAKIRKLDTVVVNRIAAGEVIQRPSNAVKELLENSIDAKSTNIQITVKDGGLKLMLIQDNGCGIRKEDLPILCERFTTSKLQKFEDLLSIQTYGFRGEALASVSHVAHLTVTTRTINSKCAYKAIYCDGALKENPKACAGNQGTTIQVEDLFYNVITRKTALKNLTDEYNRILDVATRYAIHNPNIGFTVKKQGENLADLRTLPKSSTLDNIRILYSNNVARELLELKYECDKLGFSLDGFVSNANYSVKKFVFILFINGRSVHSTALKKILELIYSDYLPKGMYPWVYLSLHIPSNNVDVNVHPTKHEVHFLHEEIILEKVQKAIEEKLLGCNMSRTFYTQTLLPSMARSDVPDQMKDSIDKEKEPAKQYAHYTVRTDPKEQKLDKFLVTSMSTLQQISTPECTNLTDSTSTKSASFCDSKVNNAPINDGVMSVNCSTNNDGDLNTDIDGNDITPVSNNTLPGNDVSKESINSDCFNLNSNCWNKAVGEEDNIMNSSNKLSDRRVIKLLSLLNLRKEVEDETSLNMREIIQNHSFVGVVNPQFALIQHKTKLYLCNTVKLSEELFYQILLTDFGNFGLMKLSSPAPLQELALIALNSEESGWTEEDGSKDDLSKYVSAFLIEKRAMLDDYFSLQIDEDGQLISLPWLLENYIPDLTKLPLYILRLATEVNWDTEKECFQTFCRETATFYSVNRLCPADEVPALNRTIEVCLYPALKHSLLPPKWSANDATFLEIANLPDLYKVFERC